MEALLQFGLANAAAAALLAIVVATVTRFWRNPYLAHVLWAIVLLRLVAPPMLQIPLRAPEWFARQPAAIQPPMLPEVVKLEPAGVSPAKHADSIPASRPAAVPAGDLIGASHDPPAPLTVPPGRVAPTTEAPTPTTPQPLFARSLRLFDVLAGVWIAGTVLYVAITAVRVQRFARALQRSQCPASGRLQDEISDIAKSIGQRRVPRVVVVDAPLPPMVWSGWRPMLLAPQRIVESIDPSQRRLLLLHELLHIRRGDHLVRWFAVGVLAVYWWNPFAWWAVRRLQNAEEECCDAAVLSFHPHDSEIYGEALLAVSEFVSCGSLPAAAVSVGVERKNHFKRRMTMILKGSRWAKLTKAQLAAVLASAVIVVTVSLTLAASQTEPPIETNSGAQAPPSTSQATSGQHSEAAGHPATAAKDSKLEPPKRAGGVETKPAAERLPAWMTAQPMERAGDDELHKLLEDRYNSALKSLHAHVAKVQIDSNVPATPVVAAARTLLDAELAITAAVDILSVYERYVEFLRDFDEQIGKRWAAKTIGADEFNAVHEARLDAEIKLRRPIGLRPSPAWLTAKALESASRDDELRKLSKERYNSALKTLHALLARIETDPNLRITTMLAAARTLRDDELAIATTPAEASGVHQRYDEFLSYLSGLISRPRVNTTTGADEINALVNAQRDAEQNRRRFSGPAQSTPSTPDRIKSRLAAQAAAIGSEPLPESLKAKLLETPHESQDAGKSSTPSALPAFTLPHSATSKPKGQPTRSRTVSSPPRLRPAPPSTLPDLSDDMFIKILAGDDETQRMLKERHNAAIRGLQLSEYQYDVGTANVGLVLSAARSVLEARMALAKTPEEQIRARQDYLDFVTSYWKRAKAKLDIGGATGFSPIDEAQAREAMFDAKLKLAQALPPKTGKEPATSPSSPGAASSPAPKPGPTPAASPEVRTTAGRLQEALPAWLTAKPLEAGTNDDELQKLLKARYNAALKSLQGHLARTEIDPTVSMTPVIAAAHTVLDADLAITAPKDTVRAYQQYLEFMRYFDDVAGTRWKNGSLGSDDVNAAHEARLDAEIKLMQAKAIASPRPRRTGTFVQSLEVRVRIAEAEVNAARAAHDQSQSEMKRALANLKYRQLQLDRIQSFRRRKAASAEDVDGATHARDEAAATVETARAAIQAAEAQGAIKLAQLEQVKMELQQARSGEGK